MTGPSVQTRWPKQVKSDRPHTCREGRLVLLVLALALTCLPSISIATLTPAAANHAAPAGLTTESNPDNIDAIPQQAEPRGVKSYLVKKAVELIAASLRKGGDVLKYLLKWLDDDAAKAVSKYGDKIADALDEIANIPGLTVNIVKEKLVYVLTKSCGLSGGTALQIADAVATTINWLLL